MTRPPTDAQVDAAFHAFVSLNEELPLRGWLLLNAAEACAAHLGFGLNLLVLAALQPANPLTR